MYKPRESKVFGLALKQLLKERSLSQRKFAKQAGLTTDYVSKLVNGEIAEPRQKNRCKIAKGLGITERELLKYVAKYGKQEAEETISAPPDLPESEEIITKPHRETQQSNTDIIEERIFTATEQLDRRGFSAIVGIQALEEIAKDSPRYHWKIMELLATFVRNAPRRQREEGIPDDIQEALTVIGRRDIEKDPENQKLDLSNSDIAGADLREAKLQGTNLYQANLQGAYMTKAQLQGADLGKANLQQANIIEANLQGAILTEADLKGAFLNKTNIQQTDLLAANLEGAHLSSADLRKSFLRLTNMQSTRLFDAQFQGADLMRANFSGATLRDANLEGAFINLADFRNAHHLTQQQIDSARGRARLPDYLKKHRSGSNPN